MALTHVNAPVDSCEYGMSVNQANRVELLKSRCRSILSKNHGDILEVGVYRGGTLVVLAELISQLCPDRKVIAVDTFSGHPYSDGHSEHPKGKYSDVTIQQVEVMLEAKGLSQYVELVQGLAENVLQDLGLHAVTFAHIDCDLYEPIRYCASYLPANISPDGTLFFDDYMHDHCPGATRAIKEVYGDISAIRLDDGSEWSCEIDVRSVKKESELFCISLDKVSVKSETGCMRLKDISLEIKEGESLAIVGPSGAGKTTLLSVMAGLQQPEGVKRKENLSKPGAIGMLFQDDVLFDWMSVAKNLDIMMSLHKSDSRQRKSAIAETLADLGLNGSDILMRTPGTLSVGQRRRVSLAIALAGNARLWLMDEPTSNFDFELKSEIQNLLYKLRKDREATLIVVTHDIEEAVFLADRVICIRDGYLTGEVSIEVPHPRNNFQRTSEKFIECVNNIRTLFSS